MALLTTVPTSIISPINDMMLSVLPVIASANIAPEKANGIENITMNGAMYDSNCAAMTIYTSIMPSTSISVSSRKDLPCSLICPA